jgi:hypothetical protein
MKRAAGDETRDHGLFISPADVAHYTLRVLGEPKSVGQAVGIAN